MRSEQEGWACREESGVKHQPLQKWLGQWVSWHRVGTGAEASGISAWKTQPAPQLLPVSPWSRHGVRTPGRAILVQPLETPPSGRARRSACGRKIWC